MAELRRNDPVSCVIRADLRQRRDNRSMSSMPPPPPGATGSFGDPTEVMGRRIGAYVIDAVIGWVVMIIAFVALAERFDSPVPVCGFEGSPTLCVDLDGEVWFLDGGTNATLFWVIGIGFWFVMGAIVQGLTGGTPGKLMVGLRVVSQDTGERAGVGRCTVRTLMWIADAAPWIFPLVGLITAIVSKGHRRVGDMVAKTLVVRSNAVGLSPQVPGLTVAPGSWATSSAPGPGDWAAPSLGGGRQPPPPGGGWVPPTPAAEPHPADVFPSPPAASPPPSDSLGSLPPPAMPDPTTPQWDATRNAYIVWDPAQQRWLQHDTATDRWLPT